MTQENIYAYIGKDRNPRCAAEIYSAHCRTIVTSHIDVFPPHIPYSVSGSKIFGTGSNDPKGSIATQIQAVEELRKAGKLSDGDIGLLFVAGEEALPQWNLLTLVERYWNGKSQ